MSFDHNYSPLLKEAMAEIKAVLSKHDIAGYVVLQTPGFSEFVLGISPTWSALRLERNPETGKTHMRFKCSKEDFNSAEEQRQCLENTVNLLAHFTDVLHNHYTGFAEILKTAEEEFEIEYTEGKFTEHKDH